MEFSSNSADLSFISLPAETSWQLPALIDRQLQIRIFPTTSSSTCSTTLGLLIESTNREIFSGHNSWSAFYTHFSSTTAKVENKKFMICWVCAIGCLIGNAVQRNKLTFLPLSLPLICTFNFWKKQQTSWEIKFKTTSSNWSIGAMRRISIFFLNTSLLQP